MKKIFLVIAMLMMAILIVSCAPPGQQQNIAGEATFAEVNQCNADAACKAVFKKCADLECKQYVTTYQTLLQKSKSTLKPSRDLYNQLTQARKKVAVCNDVCYDKALQATVVPPGLDNLNCGDKVTTNVVLGSDISCNKAVGVPGLEVAADNVVIDCNGHWITGLQNLNTKGITTDEYLLISKTKGIVTNHHTGVTIKNCKIEGFYQGISVDQYSDNAKILNNVVNQAQVNGLSAYVVNGLEVTGNTFMGASGKEFNEGNGVYITNSVNVVFKNNNVQDNPHKGVIIGLSGVTLENNNILNNGGPAVYSGPNGGGGLHIAGTSQLVLNGNTICNNNNMDLNFDSSSSGWPVKKGDLKGTGNKLQNIGGSPTALYNTPGMPNKDIKNIKEVIAVTGWPVKGTDYTLCNPSVPSTP